MLQPKRTKFRKVMKGRNTGLAHRANKVSFGEYGMGKGKGSVEYWVAEIQPGRMLYEMEGVSEEIARDAFTLAAAKLPVQTTFVTRTVM